MTETEVGYSFELIDKVECLHETVVCACSLVFKNEEMETFLFTEAKILKTCIALYIGLA